ncbi:GNAT family N-acetyltransferase [Lentzea tibetensis]|uniref:GNAT family N-acetyltransferase n=1 Tax=Lentzea tibetensis TaxID=2591470 RepID=UPI001647FFDF|nr:GNAT family N-acetyltransferase [Lentzea tibetensis]
MEPVEINAGEFYLRALRSDDRIEDAFAIAEAFADPETQRWLPSFGIDSPEAARAYIGFRGRQWERDVAFSWAICDAVTAELLGDVTLRDVYARDGLAEVTLWTHPRHRGRGVAVTALNAVLPWAFQAAELHRVTYRCGVNNKPSQRVAEKCGFTLEGRLREEKIIDDQREDMLLWSRLATDPTPEQLR